MKKFLAALFVSVTLLSAHIASAQVEYEKGDVLINLGIGASYRYAGGTPIVISGEFAINDAISVGPYFAYTNYGYRFGGSRWNYTFLDFGARGSYHFSKHLNLGTEKLDLYGGLMLGFVTSSFDDNDGTPLNDPYGSTLRGGLFGGARWYFTEKFGANAEIGLAGGVTPFLVGITFKL